MLLQVVGDDLIMSNPKRIKRAIEESTCNALLVKVFSLYLDEIRKFGLGVYSVIVLWY